MLDRCYNPNNKRYKTYGARGITVCDEWLGENGVTNFYNWAMANGWDESKTRKEQSIDRINNDHGYSPDNCTFASVNEQMKHTTRNHYITYKGETHHLAEWNRILGFKDGCLQQRINKLHWDIDKAMETPVRKGGELDADA